MTPERAAALVRCRKAIADCGEAGRRYREAEDAFRTAEEPLDAMASLGAGAPEDLDGVLAEEAHLDRLGEAWMRAQQALTQAMIEQGSATRDLARHGPLSEDEERDLDSRLDAAETQYREA